MLSSAVMMRGLVGESFLQWLASQLGLADGKAGNPDEAAERCATLLHGSVADFMVQLVPVDIGFRNKVLARLGEKLGADGGATAPPDEGRQRKVIPPELDTPEGRAKLRKAVDLGLCDENLTWLRSKELCAYFGEHVAKELKLFTGKQGKEFKVNWKPFETLFGMSNLRKAMGNYRSRGRTPIGSEIVDSI